MMGIIVHRASTPGDNVFFTPANTASADLNALWKRAFLHSAIHGGAAEAGFFQHRLDAEDTVGSFGLHLGITLDR